MDIVRILPQQHTIQQEGAPYYQLLKASQSKLQVDVIWEKRDEE